MAYFDFRKTPFLHFFIPCCIWFSGWNRRTSLHTQCFFSAVCCLIVFCCTEKQNDEELCVILPTKGIFGITLLNACIETLNEQVKFCRASRSETSFFDSQNLKYYISLFFLVFLVLLWASVEKRLYHAFLFLTYQLHFKHCWSYSWPSLLCSALHSLSRTSLVKNGYVPWSCSIHDTAPRNTFFQTRLSSWLTKSLIFVLLPLWKNITAVKGNSTATSSGKHSRASALAQTLWAH